MPMILETEQDDDMDEVMLFPITDIDCANNNSDEDYHVSQYNRQQDEMYKPVMSLRQRRWSKMGLNMTVAETDQLESLHLNILEARQRQQTKPIAIHPSDAESSMSPVSSSPRQNWLRALKKIRLLKDPWDKFDIINLPTETVTRHRYNALKKKWVVDKVQIKMEKEAFNRGAMRACFRMKKLNSYSRARGWKFAHNHVAKLYFENVDRDVYFEDVRLQMDAKLWGEEYNRHNPPKKVDIFQMCVIEFNDRPGSPLYHLEHFIEGKYIKYNSNSGFVEENLRLTPQTFSHFTFERSGHQLIVVDIQGVGDLWTDPQIHTEDGKGYGDGNLGTKGMALFFHSHVCNRICESLGLDKFDLAPSEQIMQEKVKKAQLTRCMTMVRGCEEHVIGASPHERTDLHGFLMRQRSRTTSTASNFSEISEESSDSDHIMKSADPNPDDSSPKFMIGNEDISEEEEDGRNEEPMSPGSPFNLGVRKASRVRFLSESDESSTLTTEEERIRFQQASKMMARSSSVACEMNLRNVNNLERMVENSVLGQIHHEWAKYHEIGRFKVGDKDIDVDAALFHEGTAADLGVMEAILTMAKIYLSLPHDVLANFSVEENNENLNRGVDYMEFAGDVGDRSAMIYMAKAYETGYGLGSSRTRSYKDAVEWYEKAINTTQADDSGDFDATMDDPLYILKAKVAELYLSGEYGLEKDPSYSGECYTEAADAAMTAMKGRLANKYYALAEEAWGQVEEE